MSCDSHHGRSTKTLAFSLDIRQNFEGFNALLHKETMASSLNQTLSYVRVLALLLLKRVLISHPAAPGSNLGWL